MLLLLDMQCDDHMNQDNFAVHIDNQVFIKCCGGFSGYLVLWEKMKSKDLYPRGPSAL